jgi:hypothetical protein
MPALPSARGGPRRACVVSAWWKVTPLLRLVRAAVHLLVWTLAGHKRGELPREVLHAGGGGAGVLQLPRLLLLLLAALVVAAAGAAAAAGESRAPVREQQLLQPITRQVFRTPPARRLKRRRLRVPLRSG